MAWATNKQVETKHNDACTRAFANLSSAGLLQYISLKEASMTRL